jgi:anti-anti-sigma regulatory factor
MAFQTEILSSGNDLIIKLIGKVDESANFGPVPPKKTNQRLILDLEGVTLLNSVGLRSWVLWTRQLDRPEGIFLRNCTPAVVHQMNILEGFLPLSATVESFQVPYHCESCGFETALTLQRGKDFIESVNNEKEKVNLPDSLNCSQCNERCEADIIPSKYLHFLRRKNAP